MTRIPDLLELLKSGTHFGHQLSKRNPKMKPYIFTEKNGFHIINLEITQRKLQEALDFAQNVAAKGGTILFLGTKKQAKEIVKKHAQACGMPYVTERWLGGTFTNFKSVSKQIKKYTDLKKKKLTGELEKYTKKERVMFDKEISKLEETVGGIEELHRIPEAVFACDLRKEKTAVNEANKLNIPIIGVCDTNVNPEKVAYAIPANDDSVKSIELITSLISQAIIEGKAKAKTIQAEPVPAVTAAE
jgi:small subunit ribosomal protein S2